MVGGALGGGSGTCPPGVWCLDTGIIVVALLLLGTLAFIGYQIWSKRNVEPVKPTIVVVTQPAVALAQAQPVFPTIVQQSMDPRFQPLAPERSVDTPPDLRGFPSPPIMAGGGAIPINQPTRGIPEQFQQVGVLTAPGGTDTSATPTRTILPLFGRKAATNRDRWNYYTRTDGMNPVQVPLEFKRRKCDDDNGCEEISDGDAISVPIMGQSYVANVYRYSVPRYLPV
jgi:hypothetical protein